MISTRAKELADYIKVIWLVKITLVNSASIVTLGKVTTVAIIDGEAASGGDTIIFFVRSRPFGYSLILRPYRRDYGAICFAGGCLFYGEFWSALVLQVGLLGVD